MKMNNEERRKTEERAEEIKKILREKKLGVFDYINKKFPRDSLEVRALSFIAFENGLQLGRLINNEETK